MRLVLLPGLNGTGQLFAPLAGALAGQINTQSIAYPETGEQSYPALTAFAADQLPAERCILLGESFSGPIAVELAARFPHRIAGLILAVTFLAAPWPPRLIRLISSRCHRFMPMAVLHAVLMGRNRDSQIADELTRIVGTLEPRVVAARLGAIAACDTRERIRDVACPILVLQATRDRLVPSRALARTLRTIPNADIRRLPGPHMLLQCNPSAAAHEIIQFANRLGTSP